MALRQFRPAVSTALCLEYDDVFHRPGKIPGYTSQQITDFIDSVLVSVNEGDVVLTPFPQADDKTKNRPAIVLRIMRPFDDLWFAASADSCASVCRISTRLSRAQTPISPPAVWWTPRLFVSAFSRSYPRPSFSATLVPSRRSVITACCVVSPSIWRSPQVKRTSPNHALQRTAPRVTVAAILRPRAFTLAHLFP